jgi:tryptophan-rich hypothetical protein
MKKLLNTKWTAKKPTNKEKHFLVVEVKVSEIDPQKVESVMVEAIFTKRRFKMKPQGLSDRSEWLVGWV